MWYYKPEHSLCRFFSGITEHTFMEKLGVGDPRLIDYLSILLARFIHMDDVNRLKKDKTAVSPRLMEGKIEHDCRTVKWPFSLFFKTKTNLCDGARLR